MKILKVSLFSIWAISFFSTANAEFTLIQRGKIDNAIVFVHGLWSNPKVTFKAENAKITWPKMMASDDREMRFGPPLSEYTIGILSYPATRTDTLSIEQISNRLLTDLYDQGVFDGNRKIFVIAHSLGGLVAKEMYLDLKIEHSKDAEKVAAIFLISTPSQGAPAANFISSLPNIISGKLVSDIQTIDVNTYLQSLEAQWQAVLRNRSYRFPIVYCAYETQKTGPITVVSQTYTATFCDETPRAENTDHINIVKPLNIYTSIYRWVRGRIAHTLLNAPNDSVVPEASYSGKSNHQKEKIQKYVDQYLTDFSDIDFSGHLGCNMEKRAKRNRAESLLKWIETLAHKIGEDAKEYLDFVKNQRGEYVTIEPYDIESLCAREAAKGKQRGQFKEAAPSEQESLYSGPDTSGRPRRGLD